MNERIVLVTGPFSLLCLLPLALAWGLTLTFCSVVTSQLSVSLLLLLRTVAAIEAAHVREVITSKGNKEA